jgi:hypothetical protein
MRGREDVRRDERETERGGRKRAPRHRTSTRERSLSDAIGSNDDTAGRAADIRTRSRASGFTPHFFSRRAYTHSSVSSMARHDARLRRSVWAGVFPLANPQPENMRSLVEIGRIGLAHRLKLRRFRLDTFLTKMPPTG